MLSAAPPYIPLYFPVLQKQTIQKFHTQFLHVNAKMKPDSRDAYFKAPEFIVIPHPMCRQQNTNDPSPTLYKILLTPCAGNSPYPIQDTTDSMVKQ